MAIVVDSLWIMIICFSWSGCNGGVPPNPLEYNKETGCPYYSALFKTTCYSVQVAKDGYSRISEARETCLSFGMDLVSWQSADELEFIRAAIESFDSNMTSSSVPLNFKVWTGLQVLDPPGTDSPPRYAWVNQMTFDPSALAGMNLTYPETVIDFPAPVCIKRSENHWNLMVTRDSKVVKAAVCSSKKVLSVYSDAEFYLPMDTLRPSNSSLFFTTFDVPSFTSIGNIPKETLLTRTRNDKGLLINDTTFEFFPPPESSEVCLYNPIFCQYGGMAVSFWMKVLPSNPAGSCFIVSGSKLSNISGQCPDVISGVVIEQPEAGQMNIHVGNESHKWSLSTDIPTGIETLVIINWSPIDAAIGLMVDAYWQNDFHGGIAHVHNFTTTTKKLSAGHMPYNSVGQAFGYSGYPVSITIDEFALWYRPLCECEHFPICFGLDESAYTSLSPTSNLSIAEVTTIFPTNVSSANASTTSETTNSSPTHASTTSTPTTHAFTSSASTTAAPAIEALSTQSHTTSIEAASTVPTSKSATTEASTTEVSATGSASTPASTTVVPATESTEVFTMVVPASESASTEASTTVVSTTGSASTEASTTVVSTTGSASTPASTTVVSATGSASTPASTTVLSTTESASTEASTTVVSTTKSATTELSTTGGSSTSCTFNQAGCGTTTYPRTLEDLMKMDDLVNVSISDGMMILEDTLTILDGHSEIDNPSKFVSVVDIYMSVGNADKLQNASLQESKSFVQTSLSVANSLLDDQYIGLYADADCSGPCSDGVSDQASKVASTTEKLMESLAEKILAEDEESFYSSSDNIATEIQNYQGNGNVGSLTVPEKGHFDEEIPTRATLPAELFQAGQKFAVVSILYRSLDSVIGNSSQKDVKAMFTPPKSSSAEISVLSKVLSITVVPQPANANIFANYPVNMTFQTQVYEENAQRSGMVVDTSKAVCAHWVQDTMQPAGGSWSSAGCSFTTGDDNFTKCACSHLTNFAVLMQITDIEVPTGDQRALEVISYIGCSLSVACVILLLATYAFLNMKTDRVLVHINLAIAVGIARIMFLFLDSPPKNSDGCVVVAMLVYYFNVASFFWMLLEGIHLYLNVVVVFNIENSKLKIYMPVGWGLPLVLTAVTAGIFSDSIRESDVCWLRTTDNSIWLFVAPILAVIATNTYFLLRVVKVIFKLSAADASSGLTQTKQALRATLMLQPVLGLTWVFGVLTVSSSLIVFQYIFSILNSLQGVLLFLFYCVFNSEVKDAFKRRQQTWKTLKMITVVPLEEASHPVSSKYKDPDSSEEITRETPLSLKILEAPSFS